MRLGMRGKAVVMVAPLAEIQKSNAFVVKITTLICLAIGADSPAAWNMAGTTFPSYVAYISVGCILILSALAGVTLFRRREDGGVKKYKWFGKPMTRVRRGGLVQAYDLRHERMFRTFEESNDFIFRSTVLILLTGFGLISNFRAEIGYQWFSFGSVLALAVLAGITLFKRRAP
jgi:hypothetical protein